MVIAKAQQPRLHWDHEEGWVVDVEVSFPPHVIKRWAEWALPHQIDRWRALPPGDKKEECKRSVEALKAGKIKQRLLPSRHGEAVVFQSTERMNKGKAFFHGEAKDQSIGKPEPARLLRREIKIIGSGNAGGV